MNGYKLIEFKKNGDGRGFLIAVEANKEIPFEIKRVYYIYDTPKDVIRGRHAHKTLQQVIVCLKGSCNFMLDDGKEKVSIHLDEPDMGLYIGNNVWREFTNFSSDCVLMVLASEYYDEEEYIRDYSKFLEEKINDTPNFRRKK